MEEKLEQLGLTETNFEPDKANRVQEMMDADFPITLVRKLPGPYSSLINYYVKERFKQFLNLRATFDDLAELAYADFEDWTENDFKAINSGLLRHLRNHFISNGIAVERRPGLPIARAMAEVLADASAIPLKEDRSMGFVYTPIDGSEPPVQPLPRAPRRELHEESLSRNSRGGNASAPIRESYQSKSNRATGRLVDITKCIRKEHIYRGLPDEDFERKKAYILSSMDLVRIEGDEDRLSVLPFFLSDQAALTFRAELKGKVHTLDEAF